MIALAKLSLKALGWSAFLQRQLQHQLDENPAQIPARVIRQDLNLYHLVTPGHNLLGFLPGKTRRRSQSKSGLPAVGDWVLVSADTTNKKSNEQVLITSILPRESKFSRKEAGNKLSEQVIAANIDVIFIVTSLDDNFSIARIERYLLLTWQGGASPVIVLNKTDVCDKPAQQLKQVQKIAAGTPIHTTSALHNQGIKRLQAYIKPGTTVAVLGSSGVGKSTIINQMLGFNHFDTGAVRKTDSRGRHTTTHRELCALDAGGLIIDTPGMRELQFWADDASLHNSFGDVESFAARCKFSDCAHATEPHCAIKRALEKGDLAPSRFKSYMKFRLELLMLKQKIA